MFAELLYSLLICRSLAEGHGSEQLLSFLMIVFRCLDYLIETAQSREIVLIES